MTGQTPSPAVVQWAAQRTLDMHGQADDRGVRGRCAQCPPTDTTACPALIWARVMVRRTAEHHVG